MLVSLRAARPLCLALRARVAFAASGRAPPVGAAAQALRGITFQFGNRNVAVDLHPFPQRAGNHHDLVGRSHRDTLAHPPLCAAVSHLCGEVCRTELLTVIGGVQYPRCEREPAVACNVRIKLLLDLPVAEIRCRPLLRLLAHLSQCADVRLDPPDGVRAAQVRGVIRKSPHRNAGSSAGVPRSFPVLSGIPLLHLFMVLHERAAPSGTFVQDLQLRFGKVVRERVVRTRRADRPHEVLRIVLQHSRIALRLATDEIVVHAPELLRDQLARVDELHRLA